MNFIFTTNHPFGYNRLFTSLKYIFYKYNDEYEALPDIKSGGFVIFYHYIIYTKGGIYHATSNINQGGHRDRTRTNRNYRNFYMFQMRGNVRRKYYAHVRQ